MDTTDKKTTDKKTTVNDTKNNSTNNDVVNHKEEKYIDIVYNELCKILKNDHVNLLHTPTILLRLMQLVEEFDDLKGFEKKDLILHVLNKYDQLHPDEPNLVIDSLSGFIDLMVGVDRGELVISLQPEKCLSCCFPGITSFRKRRQTQYKKYRKKIELEKKKELIEKELEKINKE